MAALEQLVLRLRRIQVRGGAPVSNQGARDWYEVMLFPGAAEQDLAAVEVLLGKRLPADLRAFLAYTNGANLFVNESGLHGVGVASTGMLPELNSEEAEVYGAEALQPFLIFARVNGAGDFLVLEVATGRVLDGVHAEQPHEWQEVAPSFAHWLQRFVETNGAYYWIERLYETSSTSH